MKSIIETTKNCIWDDLYNRYFVIFSIGFIALEYFIWIEKIVAGGVFVYSRLTYFPVQLLLLIFVLHLLLSIYSFDRDEHVSHLLLGTLPVFSIFTLILELFYLYGGK